MVTTPFTNVLNTQNQMNMMSRPTGSFSGMSSQINTNPSPAVLAQKQVSQGLPRYQPKSYQPDGMPGTTPPAPASQTVQRMNPYDQGAQLSQRPPESFPAQPFQNSQPLFPQPQQPQVVQVDETQQQQPPLAMAKGGAVSQGPERLIAQIRKKFAEQGIDFDKIMAMRLKHMGQKGDTMLAHINPEEARLLKEHGGSGKTNPHTGLPSFGVDDGPEQGATGSSASTGYNAGYGGADTSSSDTSSDTSTQTETPTRDRDSYGRESESYVSPTSDATTATLNLQRATNDAFDFADQTANEREAQQSILGQIGNIIGQTIGITPAEAGQKPLYDARNVTPQMVSNYDPANPPPEITEDGSQALLIGTPTAKTNPLEGMFVSATGGVYPGGQPPLQTNTFKGENITPVGIWTDQGMSMPGVRSPEQMASVQNPTDDFYERLDANKKARDAIRAMDQESPFDKIVNTITSEAVAPLAVNALPTTATSTAQPQAMSNAAASVPPVADVYNYTPPATQRTINPLSPAAIQAAQQKSMSNFAAAQAAAPANKTFDEYGGNAPVNVPFPVPRPTEDVVTAEGEPVTKAPVTGLPKGPPMPPIPYRDLGEGNILDSLLKPFGLDTESWINNKAAEYEKQGLTPSDAAIRASYDLRDLQLNYRNPEIRELYGADAGTRAADKAILEAAMNPVKPTTNTTTPTTPPPTPVETKPYRTRRYPTAEDLLNYGMTGGEYSFYDYPAAKKGGYISPLKAVKKNG